jgi:glycosyltransferase involved in cell wall biosynthesis
MSEPIRILHVIGIMNHGGAETMIMNLYRNIDRTKVQFDFVENEGEQAAFDEEILSLGGRIFRCPRYRGTNHFAYTKWWQAFFESHREEYPVVHGHIGSTAAIYLSIAKKHGAYAIAHSHSAGEGSFMYRLFAYPTRYIADHFFACSVDAGLSRYGKRVGSDAARCQVLNNAIDTRKFLYDPDIRQQMREQLRINKDYLVIGHVGRFHAVKNHTFLLDVFARLNWKDANTVLLLVGDGDLRGEMEQKARTLGISDRVIFSGVRSDVPDLMQAMDCFVFPSLYEGLPVTLIEAQAAGLPCIVSDAVPAECAVTNLVKSLSLSAGASQWAEEILKTGTSHRPDTKEQMIRAGYDMEANAQWLQNFYQNQILSLGVSK